MIKFYISFTTCVLLFLCSCSGHKKHLTDRTKTDTLSVAESHAREASHSKNPYYNSSLQLIFFKNNVNFYGSSESEHWELFVTNDSSFTFKLNDDITVYEFSKAIQVPDAPAIKYHSKKVLLSQDTSQSQKSITITITNQKALEKASINYLPFSVVIAIENQKSTTIYSGGGFYITNPALNDIWVLDSLNNEKVDAAKFPQGLPRLEFHLVDGSVYGFSGCNEIADGSYYAIRNKIDITLPKHNAIKRCSEMSGEIAFLSVLNKKRFSYSINNLRLTLEHADKTKLVFKKVD